MKLQNLLNKRTTVFAVGALAMLAGAAVARMQTSGENPFNIGVMEPCGYITYFHCETNNNCENAVFYQNYDPATDHFSDPYGSTIPRGQQTSIRDEPYRTYGARGVRAAHEGKYGFYSRTCFP